MHLLCHCHHFCNGFLPHALAHCHLPVPYWFLPGWLFPEHVRVGHGTRGAREEGPGWNTGLVLLYRGTDDHGTDCLLCQGLEDFVHHLFSAVVFCDAFREVRGHMFAVMCMQRYKHYTKHAVQMDRPLGRTGIYTV